MKKKQGDFQTHNSDSTYDMIQRNFFDHWKQNVHFINTNRICKLALRKKRDAWLRMNNKGINLQAFRLQKV